MKPANLINEPGPDERGLLPVQLIHRHEVVDNDVSPDPVLADPHEVGP